MLEAHACPNAVQRAGHQQDSVLMGVQAQLLRLGKVNASGPLELLGPLFPLLQEPQQGNHPSGRLEGQ
eukprot:8929163-Alexandrium_andersonii.AAC.1